MENTQPKKPKPQKRDLSALRQYCSASLRDLPCSLLAATYFTPIFGEICVKSNGFTPWLSLARSSWIPSPRRALLLASVGSANPPRRVWDGGQAAVPWDGGQAAVTLLPWPWLVPSVLAEGRAEERAGYGRTAAPRAAALLCLTLSASGSAVGLLIAEA